MSDQRQLFSLFDDFSQNLMVTLADVEALKKELEEVFEQNANLRLENDKLRDRLNQLTQEKMQPKLKSNTDTLLAIYLDGFHVCNDLYGQRRDSREECLMCDELLNRE